MNVEVSAIESARRYYLRQVAWADEHRGKLAGLVVGDAMYSHHHNCLAMANAAINSIENLARRLGLYEEICKKEIDHDES